MRREQIERMKESQTLILKKGQLFWHYAAVTLLLIPPIMTTVDVFKYYITGTYEGIRPIEEIISSTYWFIIPAIFLYLIQKRRLKFRTIGISVNADTFLAAARKTAKELRWDIEESDLDFIKARSGFSWKSWGELITIIRDTDKILINSICDPDNTTSIASWGMNKLNRVTFEQNLRQTASNTPLVS